MLLSYRRDRQVDELSGLFDVIQSTTRCNKLAVLRLGNGKSGNNLSESCRQCRKIPDKLCAVADFCQTSAVFQMNGNRC